MHCNEWCACFQFLYRKRNALNISHCLLLSYKMQQHNQLVYFCCLLVMKTKFMLSILILYNTRNKNVFVRCFLALGIVLICVMYKLKLFIKKSYNDLYLIAHITLGCMLFHYGSFCLYDLVCFIFATFFPTMMYHLI